MSRYVWYGFIGLIVCVFGISPPIAYAARSITISSPVTSLFGDEQVILTASASGFVDGETIYIKGAFHKVGSSNYFGYSKTHNDTWVKNGETASMQPSAIIGTWDNQLAVKSDFADGGYTGEGEYGLKLGFYFTTGGVSLSPVSWSTNTLMITLSEPDPTITPRPTPTPTPMPTHTPTPTLFVTETPTESPTPALRVLTPTRATFTQSTRQSASDILGTYTDWEQRGQGEAATYSGYTDETVETAKPSSFVFALLFLGVGTGLLACGLALDKSHI